MLVSHVSWKYYGRVACFSGENQFSTILSIVNRAPSFLLDAPGTSDSKFARRGEVYARRGGRVGMARSRPSTTNLIGSDSGLRPDQH